MPRAEDEVTIGECFECFFIPTDVGLYSIRMNAGGIEVLLTRRGETKPKLVFSPGIMELCQLMTDKENQPPQFVPDDAFGKISDCLRRV